MKIMNKEKRKRKKIKGIGWEEWKEHFMKLL